MTPPAEAMLRAFWDAIPAESRWRERTSPEGDAAVFEQLATYARERANAARSFGDRGEVLIRNVAGLVAARFWELIDDPKAKAPFSEADRIADARVWVPATRALLVAAQEEAKSRMAA